MPASKLKTIVIIILTLVVILLLSLMAPLRLQSQEQKRQIGQRLETLFASYGLELDAERIPDSRSLYLLELDADDVSDLTAITALLGSEVLQQDDSTRYLSSYQSALGSCQTSRTGSFTAQLNQGPSGNNLPELTKKILTQMGIAVSSVSEPVRLSAGVYEVKAVQQLLSVPNFTSDVRFQFENNTLVEISGTLFLGTQSVMRVGDEVCISATDALVRLLSSRNALGWVGKSVLSIQQGYIRSETASAASVRFTPVWLVETDTGYFEINAMTGDVSSSKSWLE